MKFSLFFEMQVAAATPNKEAELFRNCVDQAIRADELGYHCAWVVEHHGLFEYSHSSAPEVFLAYLAARTRFIRLGHGCTLLPYRYNHPIRIAERIATLDILSNGRVNWGTARSGSKVERAAFEVDELSLYDEWREALGMIPEMWTSAPYSYEGRFFKIPPIYVVPRPVQKPHPPIYTACTRPGDAVAAGKLGIGALTMSMYRENVLADHVAAYRKAVRESTPVGKATTNHFACNAAALVLNDDYEACRHGIKASTYFTQAMVHYYQGARPVGPIPVVADFPSTDFVRGFRRIRNTPQSQLNAVIGDPVAARESISRFVDAGIDELVLVMQTGTTSHALTMDSIRVFGEKVMPHFG